MNRLCVSTHVVWVVAVLSGLASEAKLSLPYDRTTPPSETFVLTSFWTLPLTSDRQLKPINKSARGVIEFNPYNSRLEISLPMRLVREGKPCIKLREQMRMVSSEERKESVTVTLTSSQHECIADFPSRYIYDGRLINGPGTSTTLEEVKFGLQDVLLDIIGGQTAFDHLTMQEREVRARDHYIEVNGQVEYNDSRSKRVPKHADVFFDKIFPKLHDYFLDEMEDNVMVICAYSYSVSFTTCHTLRPENRVYVRTLLISAIPAILLASQGQRHCTSIQPPSRQSPQDRDVGLLPRHGITHGDI